MFEHMTVGENLMLPSLEKISFWDYIRSSRNIRKMILEENHNLKDVKAEGLGINERIQMTLERWYIFNPMVLILFEPFALCDVNGVDIVKNMLKILKQWRNSNNCKYKRRIYRRYFRPNHTYWLVS